jgi:hypothetical protein
MRSNNASIISSVYCSLGVLSLYVAAAFNASAVACDLKSVVAKMSSAKPSVANATAKTPSTAAAWDGAENHAITGFWLAQSLDGQGNIVDQRFDNWFADHNELFVDVTPPATDNVCNGTWIQSGPREFKLRHMGWVFDSTNTFVIGTVGIRDTITLSADSQSFTGAEINTLYDLNGNVLGVFGPFDLQGTRLKVDF